MKINFLKDKMYQSGILLYENTSFSKSWKSVMVGTTEVKLPMKIRFSNRDILSKKCQGCVITMIIPRSIMIFSIYQWKSISMKFLFMEFFYNHDISDWNLMFLNFFQPWRCWNKNDIKKKKSWLWKTKLSENVVNFPQPSH